MTQDRMQTLFSLIPNSKIVADIGCDHGHLVNMLAKSNKCELVIASEITEKNLQKARENFVENAIIPVKFILSDGFNEFNNTFFPDCAIISGMGGYEIIKILKNCANLSAIKCLILQPMRDAMPLRKFLQTHFFIEKDFVLKIKGKFYCFIKCVVGKDNLSQIQLEYGKTGNIDYPDEFQSYIEFTLRKYNSYLKNINNQEQREQINSKISQLEKLRR